MTRYLSSFAIFSMLTLFSSQARAQRENNVFFFGHQLGLDFNSGAPQMIKGSLSSSEAAASICDEQGSLLFYTDGNTVWDRNHNQMPNGSKLLGGGIWPNAKIGNSATQGALIVRSLRNRNQYYLFTVNSYERVQGNYPGYLRYSVIDMRLNGGLGDVIARRKNIILDTAVSEKMIVTQGDGCYYWLITRKINEPYFRSYKIDEQGIHPIPVKSKSALPADRFWGEMKVSPDGKYIAAVYTRFKPPGAWLELNYFDKTKGLIIRSEIVDSFTKLEAIKSYGVEFSENSRILYAFMGDLFQYNLSILPALRKMARSKIWLGRFPISGMRRAPDRKIYIALHYEGALAVIQEPDKPGKSCNLDWHAIKLPERCAFPVDFKFYGYGLGNPTQIIRPTDTIINSRPYIIVGKKPSVKLSAPPGYSMYLWKDGSARRTTECNRTSKQWVYSYSGCSVRIDSFKVQIN